MAAGNQKYPYFMTWIVKHEKKILLTIISLFSVWFFIIIYNAEGTFDTGDGLEHYFISRYSWKHPSLFLYLWGKPVFTLISSLFSQSGLPGMSVFQILCTALSSFFCWKIAKNIELKAAWIIPVLIFFAPVYFPVLNSGLTEPMFACVLSLVILLMFQGKYGLAALVGSFLPFVRSEAYVIFPLILIVLLFRKKYIPILLLLTGSLIYTVIGYLKHGDILWLINQNQSIRQNYSEGKGSFFHYLIHHNDIWGTIYFVFILIGIVSILYRIARYRKGVHTLVIEEVIMIYGSFFAILALHTLMYCMPGIITNLGMMRYMVTLIPVSSLIALRGINCIKFPKYEKLLPVIVSMVITPFLIISPFKRWYYPFRMGEEERVMKAAGTFLKPLFEKDSMRVFYSHPYLPVPLDTDPFNMTVHGRFSDIDKQNPEQSVKPGSIVVWDSHYSPVEGRLPLDKLLNNPNFLRLKSFVSARKWSNPKAFETHIFKRVADTIFTIENINIYPFDTIFLFSANFEKDTINYGSDLDSEKSHSGEYSLKVNKQKEFTNKIILPALKISDSEKIYRIEFFGYFYSSEEINDVHIVLQVDQNQKNLFWQSKIIEIKNDRVNTWNFFAAEFFLRPELLKTDKQASMYLWNKGRKDFNLDDCTIRLLSCCDSTIQIVW